MQVHRFKNGSAEWLDFRTNYITGTDVAALFGLDKNKSTGRVLKDKQYPSPVKIDNVFVRTGRCLEPSVILLMNENGMPVEPAGGFGEVIYVTHDTHRIGSSMDAKMNSEEGFYAVECKTTQFEKLVSWTSKPPINYLLQVQTQLLVTGLKKALLGCMAPVLIDVYKTKALDLLLLVFEIDADEIIHSLIVDEVRRFWDCAARDEKYSVNKQSKEKIENLIYNTVNLAFQDNRLVIQ